MGRRMVWLAPVLAGLGVPTSTEDREQLVSDYFTRLVDSGEGRAFALREPRSSAAVVASALLLPRLRAELGDAEEDREVRAALTHKTGPARLPVHELSSVLPLPMRPGDYASGPDRQTLRRQARKAERLGVTWEPVPANERPALLAQAVRRERSHPMERHRYSGEESARLLAFRQWLVARDPAGEALLLSVTPVAGTWAALSYFRTLVDSPAASTARYLMTQVLVDELVVRGVRHLTDPSSPIGLPNGLRHFQRMVGFRNHRVQVVRQPRTRTWD